MTDDPVVRRLHERMRAEQSDDRAEALRAIRAWYDAVEALLADMRKNLPLFIETTEAGLVPLMVDPSSQPLYQGTSTKVSVEPTAGWELAQYSQNQYAFFLTDGRLFCSRDRHTWPKIVHLYERAGLGKPIEPPVVHRRNYPSLTRDDWDQLW